MALIQRQHFFNFLGSSCFWVLLLVVSLLKELDLFKVRLSDFKAFLRVHFISVFFKKKTEMK